jgi:hypothetical protein
MVMQKELTILSDQIYSNQIEIYFISFTKELEKVETKKFNQTFSTTKSDLNLI